MKTIIHFYNLHLSDPAQKEAWLELREKLVNEVGLKNRLKSIPNAPRNLPFKDGEEIELDTTPKHVFGNQWITVGEKGYRVFDWWQEALFNGYGGEIRNHKIGHWLEQTDEMTQLRRNLRRCGYCGNTVFDPIGKVEFCDACLASHYLKERDLKLLRMLPVCRGLASRPELTEEEHRVLHTRYLAAQTTVKEGKQEQWITKVRDKTTKKIREAEIEMDGSERLIKAGIDFDNVIFYSGTGSKGPRFCIGWRNGLDPEPAAVLRERLKDFPYALEIKER